MHRLPALLAVLSLIGCATAPEPGADPSGGQPSDQAVPTAAPAATASPARPVPAASGGPTGSAQPPTLPPRAARSIPNKGLETAHLTEKAWLQSVRTS